MQDHEQAENFNHFKLHVAILQLVSSDL